MVKGKPWQGSAIGLLGHWFFLTALCFDLHSGADLFWNNLIVGIAVSLAAFAALGAEKITTAPGDASVVQ